MLIAMRRFAIPTTLLTAALLALASCGGGETETTDEEGTDVFRRQPDGRWSIARYIALSTAPQRLLR